MWHPALAHLAELDPARPVLALDLPGHGESPAWPRYDLESLTDAVHRAVTEAGRTWWRSPLRRLRHRGDREHPPGAARGAFQQAADLLQLTVPAGEQTAACQPGLTRRVLSV